MSGEYGGFTSWGTIKEKFCGRINVKFVYPTKRPVENLLYCRYKWEVVTTHGTSSKFWDKLLSKLECGRLNDVLFDGDSSINHFVVVFFLGWMIYNKRFRRPLENHLFKSGPETDKITKIHTITLKYDTKFYYKK